jgi:hypothetical protein
MGDEDQEEVEGEREGEGDSHSGESTMDSKSNLNRRGCRTVFSSASSSVSATDYAIDHQKKKS